MNPPPASRHGCMKALLLLALLTGSAAAAEWPDIMGPKRRGHSTEKGWNTDWNAKEPAVIWKVQTGRGASSCAAAGGLVYTMGGSLNGTESVICLHAETGKEVWRQTYSCEFDARMWKGGSSTTPVLDGDRLYTLSFRGQLFCWNAASGARIWEVDLAHTFKGIMPHWGWSGSPLVVGNMIVVEPGGNGSSRAAVDKLTGKVFWQSGSDPAAYASPILFANATMRGVALFNASGLVGINPRDGTELFRHEWKTDNDVNASIPVHREGRFFLASAYGKGIALVQPGSGVVWEDRKTFLQLQSPVLHGEHLYFVAGDNSNKATLQCREWATGKTAWTQPVPGNRGQLIVADNRLIVLSEKGEVLLCEASPAGYKELGRTHVLSDPAWAQPALSDHRLFLRDNSGALVCLDLKP